MILARRLVYDRADMEDVLQAALTAAYAQRRRFEQDKSFRAWVSKFLVHEAANANRRRRSRIHRERILDEEPAVQSVGDMVEAEMHWEEWVREPRRMLERLDEDLAEALGQVGANERLALLLKSVAELSSAEIATVMDAPKGTVLSWLHRARLGIRRHLVRSAEGGLAR